MEINARNQTPALLLKFLTTLVVVMLAAYVSIRISTAYYAIASFHYDSASYLYAALNTYVSEIDLGRLSTLWQTLHEKDSLDLSLRVLFFPRSLQSLFGHMVVSLPFMALFVFLTLHYIYKRSGSLLAGVAVVSLLFIFPGIYNPYMGIADFWKENIAVWILGAAFISLLLSDMLTIKRWSLISSILLGLLVMERSALAVYTALMLIPVFLVMVIVRFKQDPFKLAITRLMAFILPALIGTAFVAALQWQQLYNYYFVVGYAYTSPATIAKYLLLVIPYTLSNQLKLLCSIYVIFIACTAAFKKQYRDILLSTWLAIALPLITIVLHTQYDGFFMIWWILLIIVIASVIPIKFRNLLIPSVIFYLVLLGISIYAGVKEYNYSTKSAMVNAQVFASEKQLYESLADILAKYPAKPQYISFLFGGGECPLLENLTFIKHMNYPDLVANIKLVGFMSNHDSYYVALGKLSNSQYQQTIIKKLETNPGTIIVAYCDPSEIAVSPTFGPDSNLIAKPVVAAQSQYFKESLHWKALAKINNPTYGELCVYQYTLDKLTPTAKWQDIQKDAQVTKQ